MQGIIKLINEHVPAFYLRKISFVLIISHFLYINVQLILLKASLSCPLLQIQIISMGDVDFLFEEAFCFNFHINSGRQIKINNFMIERSPISHKTIYNSFSKLQKVSSDGRFRVKSYRVKTVSDQIEEHLTQKLGLPLIHNNQPHKKIVSTSPHQDSPLKAEISKSFKLKSKSAKIIEKNYEAQLNKLGVQSDFLRKFFELKSEECQNKLNEQRYQMFVKNFALRICKNKNLIINQLGLGTKCLLFFLNWYAQWNGHITQLDFTLACDTLREQKIEILKKLLQKDENLMSIILCNSGIIGQEIRILFDLINTRKQLFSLDLSNINSQSLNRFGEQIVILEEFVRTNQSVAIVKLNNTQLKREGLEQIWKGVSERKLNPLKVLSIANNYIVGSKIVGDHFHGLLKSGLLRLNISQNPLGEDFYKNLPILKSTTIRELDLSSTSMNSEHFYEFLQKIEESKSLSTLILDKNDFSHHWFGKIGEKLETNNSLEFLSLNECQIKTFMSIFQGLTQNKYLKKIHANNNAVDCDNEMVKRISDCFIYNRDLEQLKIKFCNLNDTMLIQMFDAIAENKKLKVLDVSENLLEDAGAESILKMLDKNYKIQYLGIEKLQFSQNLKAKILCKLNENKSIRQRQELMTLESMTKDMKSIDQFSWEDVQKYEEQERALEAKYLSTERKIAKLEDIAAKKRQKVIFYTKQVRNAQKEMELSIKEKIREENERIMKAQKEAQDIEKLQNTIKNERLKEVKQIEQLQNKLKLVNQRVKHRQNELQDRYRNHKYLQKKKKSKQRIQNSPNRRPSVGHNHAKI